jgi:hypothetical protein
MFIFTFGQMVLKVQMDVLSKPFSYCLPNNEKIQRRAILIIGIITSFLSTIIVLLFFQPKELNILLIIINNFRLGDCRRKSE